MQIKSPARPRIAASTRAGIFRSARALGGRRVLLASAAVLLLCATYLTGWRLGLPFDFNESVRALLLARGQALSNFSAGALASPPHLAIDISHKEHQRLRFKREQALELGIIETQDDSYARARVSVAGRSANVKMRLKGDYTDHLEGDKWSFRIKVKGDDAIWGMRRFSIQAPKRSGWIKEWTLHALLRHEGLIGLRYDFVDVSLNGEALGVFALEESFAKELIEFNRRTDAPILKFDERDLIHPGRLNLGDRRTQTDIYYAAEVLDFNTSRTEANPALRERFRTGRVLLVGLRDEERALSEVFDVERAATTFAILDLVQGFHAVRWKNARFYYNPQLRRLELIAYNAYSSGVALAPFERLFYQGWRENEPGEFFVYEWIDRFFSDASFRSFYFQALERITAPGYLESFFASIEDAMNEEKAALFKDGPLHQATVTDYLRNRDGIREILQPRGELRAAVEGAESEEEPLQLVVSNPTFLPVRLLELRCGQATVRVEALVEGRHGGRPLRHTRLALPDPGALGACLPEAAEEAGAAGREQISLAYEFPVGVPQKVAVNAAAHAPALSLVPFRPADTRSVREQVERGLLQVDEGAKIVRFMPGAWRLDRDLVVPPGYRLVGGPGTSIDLEAGAAIISYSPVSLRGVPSDPFSIRSADGLGQGFVVLSAPGVSQLQEVVIEGQGALDRPDWRLTGAVTFYESDVELRRARFAGGVAEDQLNLVRSDYLVVESHFSDSHSDALDVDFGAGSVEASQFMECGNDCIDLSQSETTIRDVTIAGAGDKGISVGERSRATIRDSSVARALVAVAVKDGSHADLERLQVSESRAGIAAYRKKPEFTGAVVEGRQIEMVETVNRYQRDAGSRITIDGTPVEATDVHVASL